MKNIKLILAVAAIVAAMLVVAGPASAQSYGWCWDPYYYYWYYC